MAVSLHVHTDLPDKVAHPIPADGSVDKSDSPSQSSKHPMPYPLQESTCCEQMERPHRTGQYSILGTPISRQLPSHIRRQAWRCTCPEPCNAPDGCHYNDSCYSTGSKSSTLRWSALSKLI